MQTDKLTEEQIIIQQYISNAVEAIGTNKNMEQIVRLPLQIYQWSKQLFKREKQVNKFVLNHCIRHLYVKDVAHFLPLADDFPNQPYMAIIRSSPLVVLNMTQIFLRVFILGLSIRMGDKQKDVAKYKMKQLIKNVQVECILNSNDSFSEFVIKELRFISEEFACVEFFEELRSIFNKCDTFQILEWIEQQMEQRREQFQKKVKAPLAQQDKVKHKKIIKKRVTISNITSLEEQEVSTPLKNDVQTKIPKTQLKETKNQVLEKQKLDKILLSKLAKKARQSVGSAHKSLPKLPHRFIFRSTKKENRQQYEQSYQQHKIEQRVQGVKVSLFWTQKGREESQSRSNSRVLGCQTPPQVNGCGRRLTQ